MGLEDKFEWIGPDFTNNCYCNAKYRSSKDSVKLGDAEVPAFLEVLNNKGEWQQHPVVFIHHGSYKDKGSLVMFLTGGRYTMHQYNPSSDDALYLRAENLGLTRGNKSCVRSIVKEEW